MHRSNITEQKNGEYIRRFSIILGENPSRESAALFEELGLSYISIAELSASHVIQRDADGIAVAVERNSFFIGAMATTKAGLDILSAKRAELDLFFNDPTCDVLDLTTLRNPQLTLLVYISRRMLSVASDFIVDGWEMRQGLCVLRREHEEAIERFSELESAVSSFTTPKRITKLNFPPSGSTLGFGRGGKDGTLVQRVHQVLPTSLHGLSAIEIHVAARPRAESGILMINLVFGSSNVPAHSWQVPAKMLREGWVAVRLDRALTSREQDPSIVVSWASEDARDNLALTLSDPNPLREYCAVVDGGPRSNAPLAVRVWGMVPGARVTASDASDPVEPERRSGAVEPLRFALAADELRGARLLDPALELGWKVVDFREDAMDVLVHPVSGKPTFAIVKNIGLPGVRSLSALVHLDHKDSRPVEFGLALVAHKPVHASPQSYIEAWVVAEPQAFVEVAGSVHGAQGTQNDLILATRMKDTAEASLAWARFKRIEVGF